MDEVAIRAPQARPILDWAGRQHPGPVAVPAARLVETFTPAGAGDAGSQAGANALWIGDNRQVLAYWLAHGYRGQAKLVYIDPPFDSANDYTRTVVLRGGSRARRLDGVRRLGRLTQYTDTWPGDTYLQFMYERLLLLRDVLAEDGSLWLHCDYRREHYLRLLLEEVFGARQYLNTIIWRSQVPRGAKANAYYMPFSAHYLHVFARNRATPPAWNPVKRRIVLTEAEAGAEFMRDERGFFRTSDPGSYSFDSLKALHAAGRLYAPYGGQVIVDEARRRVTPSNGGNIGVKYYLAALGGGRYAVERAIDNIWDDIPGLGTTPGEDLGYPTQKTEALLRRIIAASTHPGDLVLDCFAGSGTTAAAAHKLGRRWMVCDANAGAIQTATRRLQAVSQAGEGQASFAVYRAGDEASAPEESGPRPWAAVRVCQAGSHVQVKVDDYVSPAIQALASAANTTLPDWRAMVDSIAVDPDYDGQVFRATLADAPLKRSQQVAGDYTLESPGVAACVAVRLIDVMGEETLVTTRFRTAPGTPDQPAATSPT